jgi:hypothetical protein
VLCHVGAWDTWRHIFGPLSIVHERNQQCNHPDLLYLQTSCRLLCTYVVCLCGIQYVCSLLYGIFFVNLFKHFPAKIIVANGLQSLCICNVWYCGNVTAAVFLPGTEPQLHWRQDPLTRTTRSSNGRRRCGGRRDCWRSGCECIDVRTSFFTLCLSDWFQALPFSCYLTPSRKDCLATSSYSSAAECTWAAPSRLLITYIVTD